MWIAKAFFGTMREDSRALDVPSLQDVMPRGLGDVDIARIAAWAS